MLNPDFREFIQSLNDNAVRYLVVGGYAVAFHGHPRYTKDIDLWLLSDPANAQRIIRALEQFGFGSVGLQPDDFLEPDQIIQLGYPPARIDLLTTLPGVEFEACYAARVEVVDEEAGSGCVFVWVGKPLMFLAFCIGAQEPTQLSEVRAGTAGI
jgi:hypothetical protein